MAWTNVFLKKETAGERDGGLERSQVWCCQTDSPQTDGAVSALTANDGVTAVPGMWAAGGDGTYVMEKKAEKPQNSFGTWEVTVTWRSLVMGEFAADPLSRPAEVEYGAAEMSEAYKKDKGATPKESLATNGLPFDPPPQRDAGDVLLTVVKNFATHDPAADAMIKNTTNGSWVVIDGVTYGAGVLKLGIITATKTRETINGVEHVYYRKRFPLKVRPDGWADKLASYGFRDATGQEIWIDKDKNVVAPDQTKRDRWPVRDPWPLDGSGMPLADPKAEPAVVVLQPYEETVWPYSFA
ncbi:MAG: hypothetical protein IT447_08745 [Phycisphaerales bacterium]|nr:hypothetical protein [Phycisphaerales bacterium]